ncbi:MAG: transcription antitermination factor NusB [Bacillati bacterium ANGP1]|uniref:Transcription antitermination protein NusB n=1 Tax=Candidatus Segetimicrobium genomatis TaxID=2569760 RepID=A0A537IV79_9BACT|nr:MAG: transcription antitermination factor NusB [Terrabacteria group bacterium ANGP1]
MVKAVGLRRRARELAMRVLYEADIGRQSLATVVGRVAHEVPDREQSFFRALSEGTWRERARIDALLAGLTPEWSVDRLASTDRAILRMAIYELQHLGTPPRVVVNEAVELAKAYGTEASSKFVNGVLGAVLRLRRERSGVSDG